MHRREESAAATTPEQRMINCETGDLTGKFRPEGFNIGKKGKPAKYFFIDIFDRSHGIYLRGATDIGRKSVAIHANSLGSERVACTDIPLPFPWYELSGR